MASNIATTQYGGKSIYKMTILGVDVVGVDQITFKVMDDGKTKLWGLGRRTVGHVVGNADCEAECTVLFKEWLKVQDKLATAGVSAVDAEGDVTFAIKGPTSKYYTIRIIGIKEVPFEGSPSKADAIMVKLSFICTDILDGSKSLLPE